MITPGNIIYKAAKPGTDSATYSVPGKQQAGYRTKVPTMEYVSRTGNDRGCVKSTTVAKADGIDRQEPGLGGIPNRNQSD